MPLTLELINISVSGTGKWDPRQKHLNVCELDRYLKKFASRVNVIKTDVRIKKNFGLEFNLHWSSLWTKSGKLKFDVYTTKLRNLLLMCPSSTSSVERGMFRSLVHYQVFYIAVCQRASIRNSRGLHDTSLEIWNVSKVSRDVQRNFGLNSFHS